MLVGSVDVDWIDLVEAAMNAILRSTWISNVETRTLMEYIIT